MEYIKKNITLVVGIAVPILMMLFIAASIYLPRLFVEPEYDFLYVSGDNHYAYSEYTYTVKDGSLTRSKRSRPDRMPPAVKEQTERGVIVYVYNVETNTSNGISFEQAQELELNPARTSPDGFEVMPGSRGGLFPFFSGSGRHGSIYLTGRGLSRELNLAKNGSFYNNFRFIGWIK